MAGEVNFGLSDPNAFYDGAANMNKLLAGVAQQRAGAQLASGDQPGAISTLYKSGDLTGGSELQDRLDKHTADMRVRSAQMIHDVATTLDNVGQLHGKDAILPAFDQLTPLFKEHGATDQELSQYRTMLQQDPDTFISAMSNHAEEALKPYDLSPGQTRFVGGKMVASVPKETTVGPGQSIVETGGMTGAGASQTPAAPAALPSPAGPSDALFPNGLDHGAVEQVESNHNPNAVSSAGATGTMQTMEGTLENPGYGVRPAHITPDMTPEQVAAEKKRVGDDYLDAMQQRYQNPTLALIAYNWGPGKADAWLQQGGQVSKLPPDVRDYLGKNAVAHAMAARQPQVQQANGAAPNSPPAAANGARVLYSAGPEWLPPTAAEQKTYPDAEQINAATGKVQNRPAGSTATPSDPASVHLAAIQYLTTGTMPSMGMGNTGMRKAILKDASDTLTRMGRDPRDVAGFASEYKANSGALSDQMKRISNIAGFEGTVNDAIGLVKQYAPKALADTGFWSANKAANWWKRETNDPDMAALQNAISTVTNEYAKVISNASGGGVTSDAARNRAEEMLNSADSTQSLMSKISVLQQEMGFRDKNLQRQVEARRQALHHILPPEIQAGPVAPSGGTNKVRTYNPSTGELE